MREDGFLHVLPYLPRPVLPPTPRPFPAGKSGVRQGRVFATATRAREERMYTTTTQVSGENAGRTDGGEHHGFRVSFLWSPHRSLHKMRPTVDRFVRPRLSLSLSWVVIRWLARDRRALTEFQPPWRVTVWRTMLISVAGRNTGLLLSFDPGTHTSYATVNCDKLIDWMYFEKISWLVIVSTSAVLRIEIKYQFLDISTRKRRHGDGNYMERIL